MTIFAVLQQASHGSEGTLAEGITATGLPIYDLGGGKWLMSFVGTAKDLTTLIGLDPNRRGTGVVVEVASYWGRADPAIWSWLKTQMEGRPVG